MLLSYYSVLFSGGVLGVYTWGAKEAHTRGFSVPSKRGGGETYISIKYMQSVHIRIVGMST